jgi:hypothetical protein
MAPKLSLAETLDLIFGLFQFSKLKLYSSFDLIGITNSTPTSFANNPIQDYQSPGHRIFSGSREKSRYLQDRLCLSALLNLADTVRQSAIAHSYIHSRNASIACICRSYKLGTDSGHSAITGESSTRPTYLRYCESRNIKPCIEPVPNGGYALWVDKKQSPEKVLVFIHGRSIFPLNSAALIGWKMSRRWISRRVIERSY